MHFEFLVEGTSDEQAMNALCSSLLAPEHTFAVHPFRGKPDLIKQLPDRFRAYRRWMPEDWRIIVLVDRDAEECRTLKRKLEGIARNSGLYTKTAPGPDGSVHVMNRIAVEELEAWFLGDWEALRAAFPRISRQSTMRDPDAVRGGTWETLERLVRRAGHRVGGKCDMAARVAPHMDPDRNRSRSFQVFRDGLRTLMAG